jgi:hypothetical protein
MFKQAVKLHIIPLNLADNVEKLTSEPKQVEILTTAEFQEMARSYPVQPNRNTKCSCRNPRLPNGEPHFRPCPLRQRKIANFLCWTLRI